MGLNASGGATFRCCRCGCAEGHFVGCSQTPVESRQGKDGCGEFEHCARIYQDKVVPALTNCSAHGGCKTPKEAKYCIAKTLSTTQGVQRASVLHALQPVQVEAAESSPVLTGLINARAKPVMGLLRGVKRTEVLHPPPRWEQTEGVQMARATPRWTTQQATAWSEICFEARVFNGVLHAGSTSCKKHLEVRVCFTLHTHLSMLTFNHRSSWHTRCSMAVVLRA